MPTQPDALLASDYVICATLRKIPDVFNIELLWERVRGGQEGLFQHRDRNTLTKVAEPRGNPLMRREDGLDL